ncbi:MAG: HAMP domain-containing histidine kinase [Nitratireductor sp.]|nr:HAMP domain-containing histidine kinase [Nitratireductor sp.]
MNIAPDSNNPPVATPDRATQPGFARGLSGKLLLLTIIFVMIAEVLIFVPSVSNFRNMWLQANLDTAEAASIVYLDNADPMLSQRAQRELLRATGALSVVIQEGTIRRMMASDDMPTEVDEHIDLTMMHPLQAVASTLSMLVSTTPGTYRVYANMRSRPGMIELVQKDGLIKDALRRFSRNVLLLSLAISLITAGLVFLALNWMIVRPVQRISGNMVAFSREPDNAALIYQPTGRSDEIGIAEQRLAAFERDLHSTLRQRQHLADLGLAVSKINHDLRNILASAQLFSDRLSGSPDPVVQRIAPKLLRTIDRAANYTQSVLAYGKAAESPPGRRRHRLHAIAEDVAELLMIGPDGPVEWQNLIDPKLEVFVDGEHVFRVIMNLTRNAVQALETLTETSAVRRITVSAQRGERELVMRIADTGPGIDEKTRANLFKAFAGSSRPGGTGLGLVIAAELIRAHGGTIAVESTSPSGSVFRIVIPDHVEGKGSARQIAG